VEARAGPEGWNTLAPGRGRQDAPTRETGGIKSRAAEGAQAAADVYVLADSQRGSAKRGVDAVPEGGGTAGEATPWRFMLAATLRCPSGGTLG